MSNPAPICTHIKTDGIRCGSVAVAGTDFCYHHSTVKMALGRAPQVAFGTAAPIPFVFPEDRASMQINYFLLLQAFNEGRIDLRHFKAMMSLLKSMAANLGKTGSLVDKPSDQQPAVSNQERGSGPTSRKRDPSAGSGQVVGHPQSTTGTGSEYPIEFSPELLAKFEEIERLSIHDPNYAARIRAAVAEGTKELMEQGLDLVEISPVAGSPGR